MAVALSTLHNILRVELPGIPEPVLEYGVRKTVQQFFKESEAWRHTSPVLSDWTTALYFPAITESVELPDDTRLVRIDAVKYASDGVSLQTVPFKTRQQLDREISDWEVKVGSSPLAWTNEGTGANPRIIPIAEANHVDAIQIRSVVTPNEALLALPDFLFFEFEDDFKHGTLARLMKIPGKDWTNFEAAAAYVSMFAAGIQKAKSRANSEFAQPSRETSYGGL
jgi:hypothetical protein